MNKNTNDTVRHTRSHFCTTRNTHTHILTHQVQTKVQTGARSNDFIRFREHTLQLNVGVDLNQGAQSNPFSRADYWPVKPETG